MFIRQQVYENFLNFLWIVFPSVVWSFALHSPSLCIDSFILPLIESGRSRIIKIILRILWIFLFVISLLATWNIHPGSYGFYILQTVAFSPIKIIGSIFFVVSFFFALLSLTINGFSSLGFAKLSFSIGIILISIKIALWMNIINCEFINHSLRSPAVVVLREALNISDFKGRIVNYVAPTPEKTFNEFLKNKKEFPEKIILMLVESWAETFNSLDEIEGELIKKKIKIVDKGFSTYNGSTLQGELRELCSKYISLDSDLVFEKSKLPCAPYFLKTKGYNTIGMHGYTGNFYARNVIWSNLGISKRVFKKDFKNSTYCNGSFPGVCDKDLISYGLSTLVGTQPQFLYLLTLTSHEPISNELLKEKGTYFGNITAVNDAQIVARLAISYLIDGLVKKSHGTCTQVYVAGDHQPPSVAGNGIFPDKKIPYMVLSFNCSGDLE